MRHDVFHMLILDPHHFHQDVEKISVVLIVIKQLRRYQAAEVLRRASGDPRTNALVTGERDRLIAIMVLESGARQQATAGHFLLHNLINTFFRTAFAYRHRLS